MLFCQARKWQLHFTYNTTLKSLPNSLSGTINSIHCIHLTNIQANIGTYMYVHIYRYCRHISSIPFHVQTGPIDQPTYVLTHIPCMHLYTLTHCFPISRTKVDGMDVPCMYACIMCAYVHAYIRYICTPLGVTRPLIGIHTTRVPVSFLLNWI